MRTIKMRQRHRTDIEILMAEALEEKGIQFVEQYPIRSKHGYSLDFAIPDLLINIECDGEHYHKLGNAHDRNRNWFLRNRGWTVLRFRGKEIKESISNCIKKIQLTISNKKEVVSHED